MVTVSVTKLSKLKGAKRLDAEYYKPEYINTMQSLLRLPNIRLRRIAFITDGEHGSPIFDDSSGILYFSAQHVKDGYIDPSGAKFISRLIDERNKRSRLEEDDIVLSTVGTIGFAGLVTSDLLPANIDRHVARIKVLDRKMFDPAFIVAFLNSKFGKSQTIREATGNVQLNLFIDKIKEIVLPVILSNEIGGLQRKALKLISESKILYAQAENLLLQELKLKDFQPKHRLSYAANLSKAYGVHRIDAEYFQPAYDEVIKMILEYRNGHSQLLSYAENIRPNFDPLKYPEKTFFYVELADVDASVGVIQSAMQTKGGDAPSRAGRVLKKDDVIVSSVEGSLEKVALVSKEHEGCLASTGFFQFRPEKILPQVLLVLSKSIVLQTQLKKECAGTILTAVPSESLKRILVPVIPSEVQQKIASFVQQSHEERRRAKELLEEAKRKVEKTIETA